MRVRGGWVGVFAALLLLAALAAVVAISMRPRGELPRRVGIQAGHWLAAELPEELAGFRGSTGASAGGVDEADVNLQIARLVERRLEGRGVPVDVLPSTVPPGYRAAAFVSLHADGAASTARRGYKLATPYRGADESELLLEALDGEYARATGLPRDPNVTRNMRGYYAFSRRFDHSIDGDTPAVILEMGFVSNPGDRELLTRRRELVADAIAEGVLRYLRGAGFFTTESTEDTETGEGR